jgi:uncharacterized protein involved in cysteine biosynthesis
MKVIQAFLRGLASQLHPAMLALLVGPFLLSLVLGAIGLWWLWQPLTAWIQTTLFEAQGALGWAFGWTARFGSVEWLKQLVGALMVLLIFIPMLFAFALVLVAVIAMPVVNRHLGQGPYKDVVRKGSWSVAASVWNAVSSLLIFLIGYVLTMPLWLIPPLAFVIPWLWWSWLTSRVMRFDSLVEHAQTAERQVLIAKHKKHYFALALMVTALNYIPPLFLLTPVLSALMFGHFSLAQLRLARTPADTLVNTPETAKLPHQPT